MESNVNIYVLIPAYDCVEYIEECLDSVYNQTIMCNVMVGVDGCEKTYKKLQQIKHKYSDLKIYNFKENKGCYITLNSLIAKCPENSYIQVFGADDIMQFNMLEEMAKNYPCYSGYSGISFLPKKFYLKLGGYLSWRMGADSEFMARLKKIENIKYLPQMFKYRQHEKQLTKNQNRAELWKHIENNKTIHITPEIHENETYKVTVLMNCYKEDEKTFKRAVESVFSNKGVEIQLIVSTVKGDKCVEWCKDYSIEIVVNETAGIYTQLNAMIPYIDGYFVTYCSSNDIMYDFKLYDEASLLAKENKKVCYSAFSVNSEGIIKTQKFNDYDYEKHLKGNFVSDCAMVETELFLKYMPFKLKYGNQAFYDLWLRMFENEGNVFIYNNNPTWEYIIRDNSQHVQRKNNPEKIRINTELKELMIKDRFQFNSNKRITQIRCSQSVGTFKEMMKEKYNLQEYIDINKPTLFFGLYTNQDYEALDNHKGRAVVLWCGLDGIRLKNNYANRKDLLEKVEHIVMGRFLANDLKEFGLKYKILPITPSCSFINPEPRGENIYIYGGHGREDNYGFSYIEEIKKRTGLKVITANKDTYTRDELMEVYKSCFIGLRLTKHDGMPNTVIEMGLMGRRCIYNGGTPNSIKWSNIDDICKSILKEYKNKEKEDTQQIHDQVFDFVNVGTKWLYEKPLKIYTLLSNKPYLDNSSGDRINEINIYKCLNQFADVYYNNQKLDFEDKINYGTNPNATIEMPKECDLYYVRANQPIFKQIKGKKIYFCVPNHQECFKEADGIAYITGTWAKAMQRKDRDNFLMNIYKNTDFIPKNQVVFNQTTYPQDLKNHSKTKEIKKKYKGFLIGHFGRVVESNYPHKLISIIDKLDNCTILFNKTKFEHPKIKIIDRVEYNEMPYVLSACDCLLYNQDKQGCFAGSLKIIEALSYGIPILSPCYEARIEELGEDYELYYDTEKELYEKIMFLKNNPIKKLEIGKKLLKRAEKFNLQNNSISYEIQILKLWEKN